jgi:hypothetical protein
MGVSLRPAVYAALAFCLSACSQPAAPPQFERVWKSESDKTLVHRSGIRLLQQAGRFHRMRELLGEMQDVIALYVASEPGEVRVHFSGSVLRPAGEACDTRIDRIAKDEDRPRRSTKRIESWRNLTPLFAGMETGRAAAYDSERFVDGAFRPLRLEVYVLCGAGGSWIVQYRAEYPPDVQGSTWINELIAATAPL